MEDMTLDEKLQHLRGHQEWKCQKKKELLSEHKKTWKINGLYELNNVDNMILDIINLNDVAVKITVDIGLNPGSHWSNNEASLNFINY